jgi:hypothetical protein
MSAFEAASDLDQRRITITMTSKYLTTAPQRLRKRNATVLIKHCIHNLAHPMLARC